jgi:hypothetical protein
VAVAALFCSIVVVLMRALTHPARGKINQIKLFHEERF